MRAYVTSNIVCVNVIVKNFIYIALSIQLERLRLVPRYLDRVPVRKRQFWE